MSRAKKPKPARVWKKFGTRAVSLGNGRQFYILADKREQKGMLNVLNRLERKIRRLEGKA